MASLREIKKRIRSAQNIGKVTKALQMISAIRMRKAQTDALLSRPYASELVETLRKLPTADVQNPLLTGNESQKQLIIIVAPDRGLAGPLITNLYRAVSRFSRGKNFEAITIGKKGASIALRSKLKLVADYPANQLDTLANNGGGSVSRRRVQRGVGRVCQVYQHDDAAAGCDSVSAGEPGECAWRRAAEGALRPFTPLSWHPNRCWNTWSPSI